MNKIFKDLLDEGRIDPKPLFEYEANGAQRRAYQFSESGQGMSAGRFLDLSDAMQAYDSLKLDEEDFDLYLHLIDQNELKLIGYAGDRESTIQIVEDNRYLTRQMKMRREFANPLGRLYTFMSFICIEEDENPLVYNETYNKQKIKRWQKDLEVEKKIPFLGIMCHFLPSISKFLDTHSLSFIQELNAENHIHLKIMLNKLNSTGVENETKHFLESRMETTAAYSNLLMELLKTTTDTTPNGTSEN